MKPSTNSTMTHSDLKFKAIPTTLRELPHWVLWRRVERDGRPTKVPFTPLGTPASVSDPNTWTDFETALNACQQDGFDGIGFVLTADTGVVCVDIDHARNGTDWTPEAMEIVRLLGTYTEVSPSGEGLHIWALGRLPEGRRRRNGVEMYDSGRFMTVTGDHLKGTPTELQERTTELAELHRRIFHETREKEDNKLSQQQCVKNEILDDAELIERAMLAQNGEKFLALWNGDISDYASQSEADLALCRLLAFWCGNDPARIERLFSQSALGQREKWRTRADYRQQTIQTALRSLHETYSGNGNGHRQNTPRLRQNPATDANHNGVDNQKGKLEKRATSQSGATGEGSEIGHGRNGHAPSPHPLPEGKGDGADTDGGTMDSNPLALAKHPPILCTPGKEREKPLIPNPILSKRVRVVLA